MLFVGDGIYNATVLMAAVGGWVLIYRDPERDLRRIVGVEAGVGLFAMLAALLGFSTMYEADLFACMRALCWGFFVDAPLVAIGTAVLTMRPRPQVAWAHLAIAAAIGLFGVYAFVIEPGRLNTTIYTIQSPKVSAPMRIVLLTDLQTDHIGSHEQRAMATVAELKPDLVLFAGDYVQGWEPTHRDVDPQFAALMRTMPIPRLGAFAVQGNVDPRGEWPAAFAGSAIVTAEQTRRIGLPGVTLDLLSFEDGFDTHTQVGPGPGFHIVMAHAPDFSLGGIEADLLVAGHTHGGQVALPFYGPPLTLTQVPRDQAAGRTDRADGSVLIVSKGIGMERMYAPRFRIGVTPEIVVIDVVPAN